MSKTSPTKIIGLRAIDQARDLIAREEFMAGRTLSTAQRAALLKEKTAWSTEFCSEVANAVASQDRSYVEKLLQPASDFPFDRGIEWHDDFE